MLGLTSKGRAYGPLSRGMCSMPRLQLLFVGDKNHNRLRGTQGGNAGLDLTEGGLFRAGAVSITSICSARTCGLKQ